MIRYIDADKTLDELDEFFNTNYWGNTPFIDGVVRIVNNQKPADVVPVVHAHWERSYKDGLPIMTCTNCGVEYRYLVWFNPEEHPYCPDCGAKMDEEMSG